MADPVSVGDIFPVLEIGYYQGVELFLAYTEMGEALTFPDWRFTKAVLNPTTGLENVTNFQASK